MLSSSNNQLKQRKNKKARISSIHKVSKVPRTCLSKLLIKSNRFSQFNKGKPCFCCDFKTTWWTNTEVTLLAKVSFLAFYFQILFFILDHVLDLITQLTKIVPEWLCLKSHP
jgi:hypothetical protein